VVFERAIAGAPATAPSHASIMTSRYTREHTIGYKNGRTRLDDSITLAEAFREAGYATAAFVGNILLQRRTGFDRGFELYDDDLTTPEPNRPEIVERKAALTADRAISWLDSASVDPFFLWVHFQDPHGLYDAPPEFRGRFLLPPRAGETPLPILDDDSGSRGIPSYQALPGLTLPRLYEARYAEEIAYVDHWIGELVAAVEARSQSRGAVVLLTADHGESLGEAERYFVHGSAPTPDQAHVPLILRAPGIESQRRPGVVHHVDVMPTLLELAGIAPPADTSGISLGPSLRSGEPIPDRVVYCDNGVDLSAYGRDGFVRIIDVGGAWRGEARDLPPMAPRWFPYAWQTGSSWYRESRFALAKEPIRSYFRQAVPMVEAEPLSRALIEMLRALGYEAGDPD
jgi:arylsulfatase